MLDKYFWSFVGKFSWEVGEYPAPFRYTKGAQDYTFELFYGTPQALLKAIFDYTPIGCSKYATGTSRNCGNCKYAQFDNNVWENYQSAPSSDRFTNKLTTLFYCGHTGEKIDHYNEIINPRGATIDQLRDSLRHNTCGAHSRKAYQIDSEWIPSEARRLGCLNPELICYNGDIVSLPGNIEIQIVKI